MRSCDAGHRERKQRNQHARDHQADEGQAALAVSAGKGVVAPRIANSMAKATGGREVCVLGGSFHLIFPILPMSLKFIQMKNARPTMFFSGTKPQ